MALPAVIAKVSRARKPACVPTAVAIALPMATLPAPTRAAVSVNS